MRALTLSSMAALMGLALPLGAACDNPMAGAHGFAFVDGTVVRAYFVTEALCEGQNSIAGVSYETPGGYVGHYGFVDVDVAIDVLRCVWCGAGTRPNLVTVRQDAWDFELTGAWGPHSPGVGAYLFVGHLGEHEMLVKYTYQTDY